MGSSITMSINKIRDEKQKEALNNWASSKFCGSIIAGTGFGKSRCAILAVHHILDVLGGTKVLLLVPTIQLQSQFAEEFHKWDLEHCLDNVEILCYQSAYKLAGNHYDLVICDEVHLGLSPQYRKFFENNTYDKLLCMTATLPEEYEYKQILSKLAPTIYSISLDECVQSGIVSPYNIYCQPVALTQTEKNDYKKIHNQFLYYKFKLGQFDAFDEAKRILADKNAGPAEKSAAIGFYRTIRERKKIVDFASNKITAFQTLVLKNVSNKILAFSGANDFTDQLCASVSPLSTTYHSKKTKKQREKALNDFKNGHVNVLCSTKALNQGLDIPDANIGIMCGITSKSLSMIQRIGRLIRFQENKVGEIYILYVENSQEEKWLKNATKSLNNVNWLP
jgi:superfamily II DNA or RNA helicase